MPLHNTIQTLWIGSGYVSASGFLLGLVWFPGSGLRFWSEFESVGLDLGLGSGSLRLRMGRIWARLVFLRGRC